MFDDEDHQQNSQEDDDEKQLAWYEDPNMVATKKGENRWKTLQHNGPYFTDLYKPHGVTVDYAGQEFKLRPDEEELVTFYAILRNNDVYRKDLFRKNFFRSLKNMLDENRGKDGHPIKKLELIDFDRIWEHYLTEKAKRDGMDKASKKKLREEEAKKMEPYTYCIWDGRKEKVANFRVEPPGLFRGRGEHPLQGTMKRRIMPEDVTINCGENSAPPKPPAGHRWKEVMHDHKVTWLAFWQDTVTGGHKYVMLAPSSAIKGLSDREKFEKARELKKHIDKVRAFYHDAWRSSSIKQRQLGVAMYFIDKLALRVGNEKDEDEADTVGCCSLRTEHVTPVEGTPNRLRFDFLGKDSIRYLNEVDVEPGVVDLIESFKTGKPVFPSGSLSDRELFDKIGPGDLNDKFKDFMPGLTAKVFRTYNASVTLEEQLLKDPISKSDPMEKKLLKFTQANTQVAILCNHQKAVSKSHHQSMRNMEAKKDFMSDNVELMTECKKIETAKGYGEAKKHFLMKHIELQDQWVEKYGSDEEKEKWAEDRVARVEEADNAASEKGGGGGSSPKLSQKPRGSQSVKRERTASPKSKTKKEVKEEEEEDSDDVPLGALLNKAKQSKKRPAAKQQATKKEQKYEATSDEDDDDDKPLVAAGRFGKRHRAEEDEKPQEASPGGSSDEDDDEDEDEDEDEEDESSSSEEEEEEEAAPSTPAKKKGGAAAAAAGKKTPASASKKNTPAAKNKKSPAGKKKSSPAAAKKKSPAKKKGKKAPAKKSQAKKGKKK